MTTIAEAPTNLIAPVAVTDPLWVVRINPLLQTRLADPDLRELVRRLHTAEQQLAELAGACRDELYQLIGATEDQALSRQLVDIRRSINNDKPFKHDAPTARCAAWLATRSQRDAARAAIGEQLAEATDRERVLLGHLLGDPDFTSSVAVVSPEVAQQAERYRRELNDSGRVTGRQKKAERGLLQYVTRALTRTSPLLRFTAVGLVKPSANGRAINDFAGAATEGARAFAGLDRAMLSYVTGGMWQPQGNELIDAHIGLSPTAAHDVEAGTVSFLQQRPDGFVRCGLRTEGLIGQLLEATLMGPRAVRDIARQVHADHGTPVPEILKFIASGCQQGVFVTYAGPQDACEPLADALRSTGDGAQLLTETGDTLDAFIHAPANERAELLRRLDDTTTALGDHLRRPARVTVEEDYILRPGVVEPSPVLRHENALGATVGALSVFDWLHDVRTLLTRAFVDLHGAGANVSIVHSAQGLMDEVTRRANLIGRTTVDTDLRAMRMFDTADGALEGLHALRVRMSRAITERLAAGADADEVRFAVDEVQDLLGDFPQRLRREPLSYSVMFQLHDGRPVFNDGLPGHGMLYSRFLAADAELGGDARELLAARVNERYGSRWDGRKVVEDRGLHGLNMNAHPAVLDSGLLADDWYGMRLVHDPATDSLDVEDADGQPLRIVAMGTGHPGLFPAPLSLATCLSTAGRLNNDFHDLAHDLRQWDGRATYSLPRLAIGDVVVSRRRWYAGEDFTAAIGEAHDHDRMAALTHWRVSNRVPEEIFCKTASGTLRARPVDADDAMPRDRRHKPQYADLASGLGVRLLPKMLARRDPVAGDTPYLEEATPSVIDDARATEWVIEISRRPGGTFEYEGNKP